ITNFAPGRIVTRARSSWTPTPSHRLSSRDQRVTQWTSEVRVTRGSRRSSSHVHTTSRSTSPKHRHVQRAGSKGGVRPEAGTGHFVVRVWPGGSRLARPG